jgi:hypothetical protein
MPLARQADAQGQAATQPIPSDVDAVGVVMRTLATPDGGGGDAGVGGGGEGGSTKIDFEKVKDEMLATLRTELRVERERSRGWI